MRPSRLMTCRRRQRKEASFTLERGRAADQRHCPADCRRGLCREGPPPPPTFARLPPAETVPFLQESKPRAERDGSVGTVGHPAIVDQKPCHILVDSRWARGSLLGWIRPDRTGDGSGSCATPPASGSSTCRRGARRRFARRSGGGRLSCLRTSYPVLGRDGQ